MNARTLTLTDYAHVADGKPYTVIHHAMVAQRMTGAPVGARYLRAMGFPLSVALAVLTRRTVDIAV